MNNIVISLTVILVSLCCSVPWAMTMYAACLMPEENKIGDYEETQCMILEHLPIEEETCHRECNCRTICTGGENNRCTRHCDSCPFTCYTGRVLVNYTTLEKETFIEDIRVAHRTSNNNVIKAYRKYDIGTMHTCYYLAHNPTSVVFDVDYSKRNGCIAGIAIFSFLGCVGCSIGMCVLPFNLYENNKESCDDFCNNISLMPKIIVDRIRDIFSKNAPQPHYDPEL